MAADRTSSLPDGSSTASRGVPPNLPPNLPPHIALLIGSLRRPESTLGLDEERWDLLIRTARSAKLASVLAERVLGPASAVESGSASDPARQLPPAVARQLVGAAAIGRHRRQMVRFQLASLAQTLAPLPDVPVVLLKGAAYIAQQLAFAVGRLPDDVDIMVPRARLDEVEAALLAAGWRYDKNDPYDQHFYRAWSHELPPLGSPGHALELDVHHTILPPTGRLKPDAARLFADRRALADVRYAVLSPADQVLHAAAHVFQDSDCTNRLRDLLDIEGLLTAYHAADGDGFWDALAARADVHGFQRPLGYAMHAARKWLGLQWPAAFGRWLDGCFRHSPGRAVVMRAIDRVLAPVDPRAEYTRIDYVASLALEGRSIWLRMPPGLLAWHATNKAVRAVRNRGSRQATDEPGQGGDRPVGA